MGKSQILRQRLIENPERMREMHAPFDRDVLALPNPPGRARKVSETVERDDCCRIEGRDMKCRRQMGEMMLDVVNGAAEAFAGECFRQEFGN